MIKNNKEYVNPAIRRYEKAQPEEDMTRLPDRYSDVLVAICHPRSKGEGKKGPERGGDT